MKLPLRIVADDRERASGVPGLLAEMEGVELVVQRLEVGDFVVGEKVVFERKTLRDFAISIIDGRLFRQATSLGESVLKPAIIVEGRASDLKALGLKREALQGALVTLTLLFGIPVLRSFDTAETARLVVYSADQLRRVGSNFAIGDQRAPKTLKGQRIRMLRTLPGIGREKARVLLEAFGSVENCIGASVEDLIAVPGIGKKTAEGIRQMVEEKAASYGSPSLDWEF